jgi:hypothetical protein
MNDEIVTRLREHAQNCDCTNASFDMDVAADEIERLREWNTEVTKLLQQAQKCMDVWQKSEDALIELHHKNCVEQLTEQFNEIERWRNIANRLGTHMGEGLYTDDWECREYAIDAYADWERQSDAQLYKYDVDPQPVWYFKNGEQV